jgi:hypothetical protein
MFDEYVFDVWIEFKFVVIMNHSNNQSIYMRHVDQFVQKHSIDMLCGNKYIEWNPLIQTRLHRGQSNTNIGNSFWI